MNSSFLMETHFHTRESSPCGKVPAAQGIAAYRERGYDGVIVTDHFCVEVWGEKHGRAWRGIADDFLAGYRAAKACGDETGMSVYLGMEIRFPGNEDDILLYGFGESFVYRHPWLYLKDAKALRALADRHHLFMAQAHPFRRMCGRIDPAYLHGIEVWNGNPRHESNNSLAGQWAGKWGLKPTVGSDYHQPEDISGGGILFKQRPESEAQIARWLLEGRYELKREEAVRLSDDTGHAPGE